MAPSHEAARYFIRRKSERAAEEGPNAARAGDAGDGARALQGAGLVAATPCGIVVALRGKRVILVSWTLPDNAGYSVSNQRRSIFLAGRRADNSASQRFPSAVALHARHAGKN